MNLYETDISCGVYQLDRVGVNPTDEDYVEAMMDCEAAIVIASVPVFWKKSVKFLKRKGFKQATRQIKNPNSNNKIVLMVRNISTKERKKFQNPAGICRDCGDTILNDKRKLAVKRRVCNYCKEDNAENRKYKTTITKHYLA